MNNEIHLFIYLLKIASANVFTFKWLQYPAETILYTDNRTKEERNRQ